MGDRAVRWDAGSTVATELGNLGTHASGFADTLVYAVNPAGTAVGYAEKYVNNLYVGERAVRWDPGGTDATELGFLGTLGDLTTAFAYAINANGTIVGTVADYDDPFPVYRAVLWGADGKAVNLNTLIDPAGGWTLLEAKSISDTNFVAGVGLFDPDGEGPATAYHRSFVLDASAAIPEPASLALLAVAGLPLLRRRRLPQR